MESTDPNRIIDARAFGELARAAIDRLEKNFAELDSRPLTCHAPPRDVVAKLREQAVPAVGKDARLVLDEALDLMLSYSLFIGHPRFLGYVCPAPDPLGAIADLIVASVNPNAASAMMTPIGHELERTVIRWLAQLLGLQSDTDGILLSGGNEANHVGLLVAREHRAPWPIRTHGFNHPQAAPLYVYASQEIHTGLIKAVESVGLGREALRMVPVDRDLRMDVDALRELVRKDRASGGIPMCVVASIGTVATGAIDPLPEITDVASEERLWVHIDGAFGVASALLPDAPSEVRALARADSISWEPHKWLRVPYEAGCLLVRDPDALRRTFGSRPSYYTCGDYDDVTHYFEKGPQNSRHLRALKVWMSLVQHGKDGHVALIARDIGLARKLFEAARNTPRIEAVGCNLCVTTFRYVPGDLRSRAAEPVIREQINRLNERLLNRIQQGGDSYLSNAIVDGQFLLRACFVNHRTREQDIPHVLDLVCRLGDEISAEAGLC